MKILTSAVFGFAVLSATALAEPPEGNWISQDGGTKVRVSACGAHKLCGTVVWLDQLIDPDTGKPKTDKHNPDPEKRARPLIGLQVARGLTPSGPNTWSRSIYNADDGRTYKAHLTVKDDGVAKIKGCILAVLCKAHSWKRVN
jgi:uncharacterized protein (DUF2147 family)